MARLHCDEPAVEALGDAAERGVNICVYSYRTEFARRTAALAGLVVYPCLCAGVKRRGVLMHLKAYAVGGRIFRTGSGSFSRPGLADRGNGLVLRDADAAVVDFERNCEASWDRGSDLRANARRSPKEFGAFDSP